MTAKRVLITDSGFLHVDRERALIEAAGGSVAIAACRSEDDVIAAAAEADALLVQFAPITARVIAALPRCRTLVRYGIGLDNVDLAAAAAAGIAVANIPDYCINEVADHSFALALALARQLPTTDRRLRAGEWKITPPLSLPALRDMTFAVIGLGRIGRAVLQRARAFGCKLAAYDPLASPGLFAEANAMALSLDEVFSSADIVSLHSPLTPKTRHLVSTARLQQMKPTALIVNTSRGGLIDTVGLAEALTRGVIAGAGLDVFESEPLPAEHPLRAAPNIILTSHTAWFSAASVPQLQQLAGEEVVRGLKGLPLRNRVN